MSDKIVTPKPWATRSRNASIDDVLNATSNLHRDAEPLQCDTRASFMEIRPAMDL